MESPETGYPGNNAAAAARQAGIRVITITIGAPNATCLGCMRLWASSGLDSFYAPSSSDLAQIYGYLAGSLCRNQAPLANAGPDFNVFLPATAQLNGSLSDDGLPVNTALTARWTQVSGPAQATINDPTRVTTPVAFPQTGAYTFRLTVSDALLSATDDVVATVIPEANLAGGSLVLVTANAASNPINTAVTVTATLKDSANQPIPNFGMRLNVAGANAANVVAATGQTNAAGQFTFTYTGANSGADAVTATAQGTGQSLTSNQLNFTWTIPPAQIPTAVQGFLASPIHQSSYSSGVEVKLKSDVSVSNAKIDLCTGTSPVANCQTIATGLSGGPGATLFVIQTQLIPNGPCVIIVCGEVNGQPQNSEVLFNVVGENKPGRVTLRSTDFTVPVSGIPITIGRKYDSLEKDVNGDFGYGWALDVYATRLQVGADYGVTFNDPASGRRVHFAFTPPSYGGLVSYLFYEQYTPEPGVYGKLTTDGCGLFYQSGRQFKYVLAANYQPTTYTYTDPYGREYVMGADGKLRSLKDLQGNTLTVTAAGIVSSTGRSVPFVRDAQGRITQITDTENKVYSYSYYPAGELKDVTLPGVVTKPSYTYNTTHHLLTAKDARGNTEATLTYHPDGRLATVTDAASNTTSYSYDLANNRTTQTNPDTGTVVTQTDAYGLLISQTNPLNQTTTFAYDAQRNLTSETNAIGQTKRYTYDNRGNRLTATDPANQTATASYNQYGAPTGVADPLGNAVTLSYDATGLPLELRDSLGTLARLTYDSRGAKLSETDGVGATKSYAYDPFGNKVAETDALGFTHRWIYDAMGRVTRQQKANIGVETAYTYDALGRLTRQQEAYGFQMVYEYDGNGNRTAVTDARNNRTSYAYDAANRLTQVTYPDNTAVSYTYNYRDQKLTETDQNNRTTSYTYDKAGRLTKVTHPDNTFTTTTYDDIGRVLTQTDERGNTTRTEYDPGCSCSGRVTKVIDALNRFTQSKYDAAGRLTSSIDAKGRETKYLYDARGRVVRTVFPDQTQTSATYDGANRVIRGLDQSSRATQYEYDGRGSLKSVTNALGQQTKYGYDADGNLLTVTDARNFTTTNEYNLRNQRSGRFLAGGGHEDYFYDAAGNLTGKRAQNGKLTTHNYDVLNRLSSIVPDASLSEPTISFTYKPNGQRATLTDVTGTTTYSYDNRNRLTSKQTPFGTLSYGYDAASNLTSTQSSNTNGLSVTYGYDVLNRLQTVTDNRIAPGVTSYVYDEVGNLSRTTQPNGVQHAYTYNPVNLLTQLNLSKSASTLARYTYTHTPARLRASMTELNGRTTTYAYDDANQLSSETIANAPQAAQNGVISYVLDAVGNRTARNSTVSAIPSTTNTFNGADHLNTDSYDDNDNTVAADGKTVAYDFRDKLKSVNGGAITLAYDGNGNRVRKTVGGVTTNYLVDELNPTGYAQVIEELIGGQVHRVYTYGTMLISQRQLVSGNWVTSHYGYDGSENVRSLTNSAGVVTDTFDYDAFGNLVERTGTTPNNYLYRGQQFDADLGFYYQRARYYEQGRGRFLTRDEFDGVNTKPQSLHKYLYANADPVNLGDPSGYLSTLEKSLAGSKTIPPAATAAGVTIGQSTTLTLSKRYLAPAIRCSVFVLAGYASVGTEGLKKTRVDEACNVAGEVAERFIGFTNEDSDYDRDKNQSKTRVFWSGGAPAKFAAQEWAKANDGITIEMTIKGRVLADATEDWDWAKARPYWAILSAEYASEAADVVHVFIHPPLFSPKSIWVLVEEPILKVNPNVGSGRIVRHQVN